LFQKIKGRCRIKNPGLNSGQSTELQWNKPTRHDISFLVTILRSTKTDMRQCRCFTST